MRTNPADAGSKSIAKHRGDDDVASDFPERNGATGSQIRGEECMTRIAIIGGGPGGLIAAYLPCCLLAELEKFAFRECHQPNSH